MRAGPSGWRELRTATAPSVPSLANSTQLPAALKLLLRQAAPVSWSAGIPFSMCAPEVRGGQLGPGDPSAACASAHLSTVEGCRCTCKRTREIDHQEIVKTGSEF